jgi:serine/threonine protein phosphatase PrpC
MKPTSDQGVRITVATAQGARDHQEDRAIHVRIEKAGWLLAVFDGHRGSATADKASKALLSSFESAWQSAPGNNSAALRETVSALVRLTHGDVSGATASIVFIPENGQVACWAVLGDSPIAIVDAENGIHIAPNHNVRTNSEERAAALLRGGVYEGGYLEDSQRPDIGLQMARSLGDADLARVLSREPDIAEVPIGNSGIVLLGTDGILSSGGGSSREQLSRLIQRVREGADAEALVQDALRRQTGDNVTIIVWVKSL